MASKPARADRYKIEAVFRVNTVTHRTFKSNLQRRIEVHTTCVREQKLGQGGFGQVWLEREQQTGELRAVKAISEMQVNIHEVLISKMYLLPPLVAV